MRRRNRQGKFTGTVRAQTVAALGIVIGITLTLALGMGYKEPIKAYASTKVEEVKPTIVPVTPTPVVVTQVVKEYPDNFDIQAYAKQRMFRLFPKWANDKEWDAFKKIINSESGWRVGRINTEALKKGDVNGACGLGQAYPCSKDKNDLGTVDGELDFAMNHIKGNYGDPINAWNHHLKFGTY